MSEVRAVLFDAGRAGPARAVVVASAAAAVAAWAVLAATVAGVPGDARAALGPTMGVFGGADLPPAVASALATLCLPAAGPFSVAAIPALLTMWLAMTVAMMLPPALPNIAAAGRGGAGYAAGHFAVWLVAALVGAAAQAGVSALGALTPLMAPAGPAFAASVLAAAGLYQFTAAKRLCLERCRRPFVPAAGARRPATFRAGAVAALDGLGCCAGLMAAMFAAGLMNLVWLAILTGLYSAERASRGQAVPRAVGALLLLWSCAVIAASPAGSGLRRALLGG